MLIVRDYYYLLTIEYVPVFLLSVIYYLIYTLWEISKGMCCHYSHFMDEEAGI